MNPQDFQTPEEMLERWSKAECKCDGSVGYLCELCHDRHIVHQLLQQRDQLLQERGEPQILPSAVQFIGRPSGDCECFCWDGVPNEQRNAIENDPAHEVDGRLYPNEVLQKIDVDPNSDGLWQFVISAVPVTNWRIKLLEELLELVRELEVEATDVKFWYDVPEDFHRMAFTANGRRVEVRLYKVFSITVDGFSDWTGVRRSEMGALATRIRDVVQ